MEYDENHAHDGNVFSLSLTLDYVQTCRICQILKLINFIFKVSYEIG